MNAANTHGTTPLHSASKDGHTACVSLLLSQNSIEVNPRDEHNNTPLLRQEEERRDSIAGSEGRATMIILTFECHAFF